jgi:uncharacterized hydrophobic protein (TIGR00271 family)
MSDSSAKPPGTTSLLGLVADALHALRDRAAQAFELDAGGRDAVIETMAAKGREERAAYWLHLLLSMAIATLGLVLGSTAVVIGAMLISPLMNPIVELAMGLAVSSGILLVRALVRVLMSVVAVVGGATLITLALPYREPTAEILARTSPTSLDLFVAVFCALAAAYTTAKPGGALSATAAGTAIGIALVPPLCVAGFGIGAGDARIAQGALLLFTANVVAIVAFAGGFFWLVGFDPVRPGALAEGKTATGWLDALILRASRVLNTEVYSHRGVFARLAVPLVLLGAISYPLTEALREVAWEVRTRTAVNRILRTEPLLSEALQTDTLVERGRVSVRAVIVGDESAAAELRQRLALRVAVAAGVEPAVGVRAVPSTQAFRPEPTGKRDPLDEIAPYQAAAHLASLLRDSIGRRWPAAAGRVLAERLELSAGQLQVHVLHWGASVGPAAEAMLAQGLASDLGRPVEVRTHALSQDPVRAPLGRPAGWLEQAGAALLAARHAPEVAVCLTLPDAGRLAGVPEAAAARRLVATWLAELPADRVQLQTANRWELRLAEKTCDVESAAAAPAAAPHRQAPARPPNPNPLPPPSPAS